MYIMNVAAHKRKPHSLQGETALAKRDIKKRITINEFI